MANDARFNSFAPAQSASMRVSGKPVAVLLVIWLFGALAVGLSSRLTTLRPPAPQAVIFLLTVASLAVALLVPRLRLWADQVSPRVLVTVHLTRFVGLYFLFLAYRGALAPAFAVPAGWGDLIVAALALVLIITGRPDTAARRAFYRGWNILGLIDILLVVVNAARLGISDPASMQPLLHLPLSLLPTFLVPVIITSHILLFRRIGTLPGNGPHFRTS